MFRFCYFCNFRRNGFGRSCRSKPAQADVVAMLTRLAAFAAEIKLSAIKIVYFSC